jgi:hypothetical protein
MKKMYCLLALLVLASLASAHGQQQVRVIHRVRVQQVYAQPIVQHQVVQQVVDDCYPVQQIQSYGVQQFNQGYGVQQVIGGYRQQFVQPIRVQRFGVQRQRLGFGSRLGLGSGLLGGGGLNLNFGGSQQIVR